MGIGPIVNESVLEAVSIIFSHEVLSNEVS
jgi:hypothetical protein